MSYDQVVMRALAQTYFATLSSAWKKNRTPEGAAKLAAENEKKKNRARREGVSQYFSVVNNQYLPGVGDECTSKVRHYLSREE